MDENCEPEIRDFAHAAETSRDFGGGGGLSLRLPAARILELKSKHIRLSPPPPVTPHAPTEFETGLFAARCFEPLSDIAQKST